MHLIELVKILKHKENSWMVAKVSFRKAHIVDGHILMKAKSKPKLRTVALRFVAVTVKFDERTTSVVDFDGVKLRLLTSSSIPKNTERQTAATLKDLVIPLFPSTEAAISMILSEMPDLDSGYLLKLLKETVSKEELIAMFLANPLNYLCSRSVSTPVPNVATLRCMLRQTIKNDHSPNSTDDKIAALTGSYMFTRKCQSYWNVSRSVCDGMVPIRDQDRRGPTLCTIAVQCSRWTTKGILAYEKRMADGFLSILDVDDDEEKVCEIDGLNQEQQQAYNNALSNRLSVLTGPPGSGKTHTCGLIVSALLARHDYVYLCAPTGVAAKRLYQATAKNMNATAQDLERIKYGTVHRLIYSSSSTGLSGSVAVVLDESSMMSYKLMQLFQEEVLLCSSIPTTDFVTQTDGEFSVKRLLMVGDVQQLPSIGHGAVLRDLIDSGVIPVTRLVEIVRQSGGSSIPFNSQQIYQGASRSIDDFALGGGFQH